MEAIAGSQEKALDDSYWQRSLEEDYWAALLEQGEIASPSPLTADHQGAAEPAMGPTSIRPAPAEDSGPDDGDAWSAAQFAMGKGDLFILPVHSVVLCINFISLNITGSFSI